MATRKKKVIDNTPKYVPPPYDIYIYIRKMGFLQPIPYKYNIPDLEFIKNYKNQENGNQS